MADNTDRFAELFAVLTNALQTAVLLSQRLEPDLRQASRDAGELRSVVERASDAVRQLRERGQR
jgi:hypothetical protein